MPELDNVPGYRRVEMTCRERAELVETVGRDRGGPAKPYIAGAGSVREADGDRFVRWVHEDTQVPLLEDHLPGDHDATCTHYRFETEGASDAS